MRNLKKFLALVLAMVMAFSLMLSASAATFDDKHFSDTEEVTQAFKEAVAVLTGLDVIKGDGDGEIKNIRPQSEITRAEAAALVYRIATGDVNDKQVALYSDYSNFTDVKPRTANDAGDWFAGYVGYCQNAGIIKGTTPTTFNPYGKVTGYEVLAMILRAVGYGKNGEFTGSNWQVNVASLAKTKHISDSVTSAAYNYTLNQYARREIVAELLFRGSLIPQVNWTPGLGYVEFENGYTDRTNYLAWDVFALSANPNARYNGNSYTGAGWGNDEWGRPQLVWKASLNPTSNTPRTVATLKPLPKQYFTEEKRECQVADLMEFGTAESKDYILYVNNGGTNVTADKYHIVAADTVTKVGGYGRLTEIYTQEYMQEQFPYHDSDSYWAGNSDDEKGVNAPKDTIVMIDTIVAKVLSTNPAVLDGAGHVITPARMTVDLYDAGVNQPTRRTIQKPATSKDNWEYDAGDVVKMNGFTPNSVIAAAGGVDPIAPNVDNPYTYASKGEVDAFTTRPLPGFRATGYTNNVFTGTETSVLVEGTHVKNIIEMDGVPGKQTVVYRNANQHQVDGKDYFDDLTLKMDKALQNTNTTYTWYYDDYGYVQAIDDGGKVNYGVITAVYAAFAQGETQTTGRAKAIASVQYANGETGTEEIDYFMASVDTVAAATANRIASRKVGEEMHDNANTIQLWPMYDITNIDPMKEYQITTGASFAPAHGEFNGIISMAPVAASNQYNYLKTDCNVSGVLHDNLWKFVKTSNDMTVAVEVAGGNTSANITATTPVYTGASVNTGDYAGHWNAANTSGKLYKNLAYITTDASAAASNVVAWLDDDTQIMVRNPANNSIATYDGVSALPGDVTISTSAQEAADGATRLLNEIDWADTDGDGRADVVYLTGTIDGLTTYGLFYFGGTSRWDGTTGTMEGWLNGEAYSLVTGSLANYNVITNTAYRGRLFAVQLFNGALQNIMEGNAAGGPNVNLLNTVSTNPEQSRIVFDTTPSAALDQVVSGVNDGVDNLKLSNSTAFATRPVTDQFRVGTGGGNPYGARTEAVYYRDVTSPATLTGGATSGQSSVTFNPNGTSLVGATVQVWYDADNNGANSGVPGTESFTYYLTPNSKVYGIGTGVTSGYEALEYLNRAVDNDVTIVYNNEGTTATGDNQRSILEIYIVTDRDITPVTPSGELNYTASVANDGANWEITVNRRNGTSAAVNDGFAAVTFNWRVYSCDSAKNGAAPFGNNTGTSSIAVNQSSVGPIDIDTTTSLTTGWYFVRITSISDLPTASNSFDTALFYVP